MRSDGTHLTVVRVLASAPEHEVSANFLARVASSLAVGRYLSLRYLARSQDMLLAFHQFVSCHWLLSNLVTALKLAFFTSAPQKLVELRFVDEKSTCSNSVSRIIPDKSLAGALTCPEPGLQRPESPWLILSISQERANAELRFGESGSSSKNVVGSPTKSRKFFFPRRFAILKLSRSLTATTLAMEINWI